MGKTIRAALLTGLTAGALCICLLGMGVPDAGIIAASLAVVFTALRQRRPNPS